MPINKSAPPYWFHNRYNNQLVLSSTSPARAVCRCADQRARQIRAVHAAGLPVHGVRACVAARATEHVARRSRIVFTASEPLYPHQRQLIEERLGARVMEYYGMAERVAYASECERGNLHVNTDYSCVEIVDEDGKPTSGDGYIVGTTFHNTVMPLVRYRVSDRTRWRNESCPCGADVSAHRAGHRKVRRHALWRARAANQPVGRHVHLQIAGWDPAFAGCPDRRERGGRFAWCRPAGYGQASAQPASPERSRARGSGPQRDRARGGRHRTHVCAQVSLDRERVPPQVLKVGSVFRERPANLGSPVRRIRITRPDR